MSTLSVPQLKTLLFLPCATAPFSVLGSALVLTCIFRHERSEKRCSVYHRLLGGLSVLDILFSLAYAFGPLPIPADFGIPWGKGTVQTCSVQGFFAQFGYLSYGYSVCLTIYFVLTIRLNLKEAFIMTFVEPLMHLTVCGFALATATIAVAKEYTNPGLPTCWIGKSPMTCTVGVDCVRGDGYIEFGQWAIVYPNFIFTFVIFACLSIVIWTVSVRRHKARRFIFGGQIQSSISSFDRKFDTVVTQCLLYGCNFFVANFLFAFQGMLVVTENGDIFTRYYPVLVLVQVIFPLQGLFNFCIFLRPRYNQWRRLQPYATSWMVLKNSIWNPTPSYSSAGSFDVGARSSTLSPNQQRSSPSGRQSNQSDGEARTKSLSSGRSPEQEAISASDQSLSLANDRTESYVEVNATTEDRKGFGGEDHP